MEVALGAANWLLGKVLEKLADDLVEAYVASSELGLSYEQMKTDLMYTQGLLHEAAQGSAGGGGGRGDNPGLHGLLQQLSKKADEAEDALDELHYFTIQDQLDGTREAAPEVDGDVLRRRALHGRHALRHTTGNWLPCFFSSRTQDDDSAAAVVDNVRNVAKLPFDRVAMSNKIKSVMEGIHTLCARVSSLLKISHGGSHTPCKTATLKRPVTASAIAEHKLYGRGAILDQIITGMANGSYHSETIHVLPILGPGGIGKTTFAKHLYNNKFTEACFSVKVWVCVPTKFDVLKLTQEILKCICTAQNEGNISANEAANLDQLQKSISRRLKSKRFLIVLDDVWSCNSRKDWENLLAPFKNGETEGNVVIVTTRLPSVAQMVKTADTIELHGLEPDDFFKLFEACVFGEDKPEHYDQDLMDIAQKIANNLKGSPLAANTVGRLLKKDLSQEHWRKVLENNEWQNQESGDDIMPSLKISYDYLPFHLKKCFSYFSLFPENYRFDNLEMTRFWIAIGIIDASVQGDNNYLEELVDNGFLIKAFDDLHQYYYVLHGLLHELARHVSSQECVNISSFSFRAEDIQPSIHHLSITTNDEYDINFEGEMGKLRRRVDIANLRTLVVIGEYKASVYNVLKDIFKEIKRVRVLFFIMDSPQSLPHNFSKLIHLRYLKIESPYGIKIPLPSTLSRFYHLKFLDLEHWHGSYNLPRDISNLVNLHSFLGGRELHSNVPEVGKMKCLQELKEFCVKKENVGFELRELGELTQLGGQLTIRNLERVATIGEARDANLMLKRNLKGLTLVWGTKQQTTGSDVLDGLQPHPNVRSLEIINHGGATGPSWLCGEICIKKLESLHLDGVSWGTLPPFGQLLHLTELSLKNISGMHQFGPDYGGVTDKSFMHLKTVTFQHMPELVEWVGGANLHLFSRFESIECRDCPNLCRLPFSGHCSRQDMDTIWFPNLRRLWIVECPKLSLPPMPHTSTLTYVGVQEDDELKLSYFERELIIDRYDGALAFHNLDKVERMKVKDVSLVSLADLQMLRSLTRLNVSRCSSMFSGEWGGTVVLHSVQSLSIGGCRLTGKSLQKSLDCLPALSELDIVGSPNGDDDEEEELVLQLPSSSSLLKLSVSHSKNLVLPVEAGAGGPGHVTSLQSLTIQNCGSIFSRWTSMAAQPQTTMPLPTSLRELDVSGEPSMHAMSLLSNLSSLTQLRLVRCDNLTIDGFDPLITFNLSRLLVYNTNKEETLACSVAAGLLTQVARMEVIPAGSFRLEQLAVDSASAALVAPICAHLSGTLKRLSFRYDQRVESFTEEEEQAIVLLASLRWLEFYCCRRLRSLPGRLRRLSSLKKLTICSCPRIKSLPRDGLPTSLMILDAWEGVSDGLKDQANKLSQAYPNLLVYT